MTQPVRRIQANESKASVAVNLLPCKIHHDGPIGSIQAHWSVDKPEDGMPTAHLRGRKLHGKTLSIPQGYRGILVQKQDEATANGADNMEDGQQKTSDGAREGKLQATGEFQDLVIWGHESVADTSSDHYVRGMEEWIEVSSKIHLFDPPENKQWAAAVGRGSGNGSGQ